MLALAFDKQGQMYALETSPNNGTLTVPGLGTIVRIKLDAETTGVIATGLTFPTAMTFGPDGMLYVSNFGYLNKPGMGQIVRIEVSPAK